MCATNIKQISHDLRFNVAQLLKEGTGATRLFTVETPAFGLLAGDIFMVAPLTGSLKLLCTGRNILASGQLTTTIQKPCGRCLEPFQVTIEVELEEEFYPSIDIHTGGVLKPQADIDDTNQVDEQHLLDLQEIARQEYVLTSETVYYCRADCLGLCPHCGQDRNKVQCDCQIEKIDARWADLLALQEKLEE